MWYSTTDADPTSRRWLTMTMTHDSDCDGTHDGYNERAIGRVSARAKSEIVPPRRSDLAFASLDISRIAESEVRLSGTGTGQLREHRTDCKEGGDLAVRSPGCRVSRFFFLPSKEMNCVRVFYELSSCQEACVSCKFRSPSSSTSGVVILFFYFLPSRNILACRTYLVHFTLHQYGTA